MYLFSVFRHGLRGASPEANVPPGTPGGPVSPRSLALRVTCGGGFCALAPTRSPPGALTPAALLRGVLLRSGIPLGYFLPACSLPVQVPPVLCFSGATARLAALAAGFGCLSNSVELRLLVLVHILKVRSERLVKIGGIRQLLKASSASSPGSRPTSHTVATFERGARANVANQNHPR